MSSGNLVCDKCGKLGVYDVEKFGKAVLDGVHHEGRNIGHNVTLK